MATQFMSAPSYMTQPMMDGHYNVGPSSGKNGGFAFRKRVERVDWRKIASVDIDHIARTLDFTTLQSNIMNITFCNLEAEMVSHDLLILCRAFKKRNFSFLFSL